MKTKQLVAFVVAAAVFVVTGVSSIAINTWSEGVKSSSADTYSQLFGMMEEVTTPTDEYVAVINVEGTIYSSPEVSLWGEAAGYDHTSTMDYVDQLMQDSYNTGIMLYMNTPGGEVTASDELYLKLMEYKEMTGRKIYCYFGDQSCSGGYYISMAADEIYANRNCWTGSIGVIVSMLNMQGLYEKLGIEEINITSGNNKAMGSSGEKLTEQQREIMQSLVDESYDQFVSIIVEGRNMTDAKVRELADGRIYSAKQALEAQLIDGICTLDEYMNRIYEEQGEDIIIFERPVDSYGLESLFATMQSLKSRSEAEVLQELLEKEKMGGLMYYADGIQ
ncbi:MAG: signal peptide peptidase SppA [Lachnospiraceae bacterium]|nr:signal peptide peptidase SppA [Lachnospiraceae bacterium]